MQIDKITIAYSDKIEEVHVKRLKFRKRAALFTDLRDGLAADADGSFNIALATPLKQAEFAVQMISSSVCSADGKPTVTPDDVDDWDDARRNAYVTAITKYQNPNMEEAAKNSSTTPTSAS